MNDNSIEFIESARQAILNSNPPVPPVGLSQDQSAIWTRIFTTTEQGWITENQYGLVLALCRHEDAMNRFSDIRNRMFDTMTNGEIPSVGTIKEVDRLSKMIEREVRAYSSLATRLRLTNQALRTADVKKPTAQAAPWEITDDLLTEDADDTSSS